LPIGRLQAAGKVLATLWSLYASEESCRGSLLLTSGGAILPSALGGMSILGGSIQQNQSSPVALMGSEKAARSRYVSQGVIA